MGVFGGYTRWAVVFLIIFVLFFLLCPTYGYGHGYGYGYGYGTGTSVSVTSYGAPYPAVGGIAMDYGSPSSL